MKDYESHPENVFLLKFYTDFTHKNGEGQVSKYIYIGNDTYLYLDKVNIVHSQWEFKKAFLQEGPEILEFPNEKTTKLWCKYEKLNKI
jgi:hypothetical protein